MVFSWDLHSRRGATEFDGLRNLPAIWNDRTIDDHYAPVGIPDRYGIVDGRIRVASIVASRRGARIRSRQLVEHREKVYGATINRRWGRAGMRRLGRCSCHRSQTLYPRVLKAPVGSATDR